MGYRGIYGYLALHEDVEALGLLARAWDSGKPSPEDE